MKILVVIHEFPPIGGGGGLIARDLALELVKRGHQVRVVTAHFGDLPLTETRDGLEIVRLPSRRKEAFRAKLLPMASFILAANHYCQRKMTDFQLDIIHAHFAVPGGPAAYFFARRKHIPYVLTIHLGDIPGASPEKTGKWFKVVYPLSHFIWNGAAKIIAVSQFSRTMALKKYDLPIEVIPNGIDYEAVKIDVIAPHAVPQIVFAGRFVPQKNVPQIVRALAPLRELDWHCTLLGDGQKRAEIEALIAEHKLQNKFSITGWVKPEEVTETFKKSDILFLPSRSEGLPIVGIQAMTCGLALLVSDAGGNPELVAEGVNGFQAAADDTDTFTERLRLLLTQPELLLRFREKSLEMAQAYDIRLIAAQYEQAFRSCLPDHTAQ